MHTDVPDGLNLKSYTIKNFTIRRSAPLDFLCDTRSVEFEAEMHYASPVFDHVCSTVYPACPVTVPLRFLLLPFPLIWAPDLSLRDLS